MSHDNSIVFTAVREIEKEKHRARIKAQALDHFSLYETFIKSDEFLKFYYLNHAADLLGENILGEIKDKLSKLLSDKKNAIEKTNRDMEKLSKLSTEMQQFAELIYELQALRKKLKDIQPKLPTGLKEAKSEETMINAKDKLLLAPFVETVSDAAYQLSVELLTTTHNQKELKLLKKSLQYSHLLLSDPKDPKYLVGLIECNLQLSKLKRRQEAWRMFKSRLAMATALALAILTPVMPLFFLAAKELHDYSKQLRISSSKEVNTEALSKSMRLLASTSFYETGRINSHLKKALSDLELSVDKIKRDMNKENMDQNRDKTRKHEGHFFKHVKIVKPAQIKIYSTIKSILEESKNLAINLSDSEKHSETLEQILKQVQKILENPKDSTSFQRLSKNLRDLKESADDWGKLPLLLEKLTNKLTPPEKEYTFEL